jgi:cytoskeleton protein RodZ
MTDPRTPDDSPAPAAPSGSLPADPGTSPVAVIDSVGALVAAREARGLGSADIVAVLKLSPRQVSALEAGDWAALPGLAFSRAALRSYGRLLGVSVEPLVASLLQGVAAPELREAASLRAPLPRTGLLGFGAGGSGSRLAWLVLAVALLVVVGLFFGRPAAGPSPDGKAAPGPAAAEVPPAAVAPAAPAAAAAPSTTTTTTPPASTAAPAVPASAPAPAAAAAAAPAAPTPTPAAPAAPAAGFPMLVPAASELVLRFERESWVEIRRADGQVVLEGLQRGGTEARLSLSAELSLVVGNADFVRIERGGVPVDLKPLIRQGVARLKLAP